MVFAFRCFFFFFFLLGVGVGVGCDVGGLIIHATSWL